MDPADSTKHVLVVDDEELVRQLLTLALTRSAWVVDTAGSAEEALLLIEKNTYGVVVVDKNLPGMSGVDLIRKLREHDEAVAALMITAYGSVDSAIETLHLGVDGYLEKPFDDILTVVRAIDEAFGKYVQRRAGSLSGAVDHFRKAAGHLRAVEGSQARLSIAVATASDRDGAWVIERLREAGDTVTRLDSRQAMMATVCGNPPQVLLVDSDLCQPDVAAQVAEVRTLARDTAVIVMTSRPSLEVVARLIRLDVLGVLEKPLDDQQFKRRIPAVLDRLRARTRSKKT